MEMIDQQYLKMIRAEMHLGDILSCMVETGHIERVKRGVFKLRVS